MPFYREVTLPLEVPGRLLVARMPGRFGEFDDERQQLVEAGVELALCLVPMDEIEGESPEYAQAIAADRLLWGHRALPIPDFGVPEDREDFLREVRAAADHLLAGRTLLIHCGAGIGRTGTVAVCVLMALGMARREALAAVQSAGAGPESWSQEGLVTWVAAQLGS